MDGPGRLDSETNLIAPSARVSRTGRRVFTRRLLMKLIPICENSRTTPHQAHANFRNLALGKATIAILTLIVCAQAQPVDRLIGKWELVSSLRVMAPPDFGMDISRRGNGLTFVGRWNNSGDGQ